MPLSIKKLSYFVLSLTSFFAFSQDNVFSDDFSTSTGTSYTTSVGPIGTSSTWNMSRSGTDFGAMINSGRLNLINDASGAANVFGWALAHTNASNFAAPYNTVLGSNPGMVTWSFNMRQIRSNPTGFGDTQYGVALILAGTSGTTNTSGSGYAIVLGNSTKTDVIRLVRYTAGIRNHTTLVTSNTTGLTDFGREYLSIKVTFNPTTNTWQLFLRNDGTTAFADPTVGNLALQGSVINNSSTTTSLPILGCYWNANSNVAVQTSFFDNIKVSVVKPIITTLSPPSTIAGSGAFTLIVNGENFVNGVSTIRWNGVAKTTTFISANQISINVPASDIITEANIPITVSNGTAISNVEEFDIDPAGQATLSVSTTSLSRLTTTTGTVSSSLSYTISGVNLTEDVTITPPSQFEVSTDGTTYSNTLTLPRVGFSLPSQTIFIRVKSSATAGLFSANVVHATVGAVSKNILAVATVLDLKPTIQSSAVTFTTVTSTSFTVNWTNGNGSRRLVLIKSGSAVTATPVDGVVYNANTVFGGGAEIGTGNYVAYVNSGNSVTITDMTAATTYHVAVYELNGLGGTENYLTPTPATGNKITLNAPVGWQIYTANALNTIDFDTTVDGVNNGVFQGAGFTNPTSDGELNSSAWSVLGFTDGGFNFGGSHNEDTDFDRGIDNNGVDLGGIYAFETTTNNFSLGIQPATGDFTPGSVSLRFQNQTGATITSISVGYKVYIYNDQEASSSLNLSYSSSTNLNNILAYTSVAGIDVVSPTTADVNPTWKAYYRVVTIPLTTSIANLNYGYLRWTGATVSGSGSFDEFAIDDIAIVANPSTNFASFSGNAESFIVQGNTSLAGNTTVNGALTLNSGKLDVNGKTLTIGSTVTNNVVGGIKGSATSNLTITGTSNPTLSFDQTTLGTTNLFNNLTISTSGTSTVTISNPVVINGTLTTNIGQTLNLGTNALTGTLTGILNNGTISTQNTTSLPLPSSKTWNGIGTINYNATSTAQTVVVGTYTGLTISTTGGGIATGNITVNGILHLANNNPTAFLGSLSMGSNTLSMGANATNTGNGDVTGIVTRTTILPNIRYTYGHPNTSILFPDFGTLPTVLSLKTTIGTAPTWKTDGIKRIYDLIHTGANNTKAVIRAHYLDSEVNGNSESKLVYWSKTPTVLYEQGKSNFDSTDNWIELTNANIGLYFATSFDVVYVTLGNSTAVTRTWNGAVSTSWTTAANWTPSGTPDADTAVIIPNAATTPFSPILNPSHTIKSLIIENGGVLNSYTGVDSFLYSNLTLSGDAGTWINNGTFNSINSTIIFTNANATIAGTTQFDNLTNNAGAGLTLLGNSITKISGVFTQNGTFTAGNTNNSVEYNGINQNIVAPNGELSAYRHLIISGTGAIFPTSLNVRGDLTINQSVNFAGKSVVLTGIALQTIQGTFSPVFNNVTINNTFGEIALGNHIEITGTLTLMSGRIKLGNYNLTLGSTAVAGTFSTTNMIYTGGTGELRRKYTSTGSYTFPIGETTNFVDYDYSPITINVTAGSFSNAYIGVNVTNSKHPNNYSELNNINRYWSIKQSGISGAIATINASYLPTDLTGAENSISAAELTGVFNQSTNPWVKLGALSGNVLTATNASLTQGTEIVFTGIKGGVFTAPISGYGSFCENAIVTLLSTPNSGDAPYIYNWTSGLGTNNTATPATNTAGSQSYSVTVKDANGLTAFDTATVIVSATTQGGSVSPNQNIGCGVLSNLTLSGSVGTVLEWQKATDSGFSNAISIPSTATTLTVAQMGTITEPTYFRAIVQNGACDVLLSTAALITIGTNWNGSTWSNGIPTATSMATISGNYSAATNLNACSLTITNNAVVTIPSGFNVTIDGAITVNTGSSFVLENNANLIQNGTTNTNSGAIVVKRNTNALKRLDYTLWSSPVANQNLLDFSPLTTTNRFYAFDTSNNAYSAIAPSTNIFSIAQGYLIRTPNTHPTTATIWNGVFTGVPNNGTISKTINWYNNSTKKYNLVGNPYPSTIDAKQFITHNADQIDALLYFWRKTNDPTKPSYCSWVPGNPVTNPNGIFVSNGEAEVYDPLGIIQTGQGFFVVASNNSTTNIEFTNAMRVQNNANQFFKQTATTTESNLLWLNLTNAQGGFCQTVFGYIDGATNGFDSGLDGVYYNEAQVELYSIMNAEHYVIQSRALPFIPSDSIPLGFKVTTAGNYSISKDHAEGLFNNLSQVVYLKDNQNNTLHNLNAGSYNFTSEAGTFDLRFEIVYQTVLGNQEVQLTENNVIVYKQNNSIIINSGNSNMSKVEIYDVTGRLITFKKEINSSETSMQSALTNQVLLVKVYDDQNRFVVKKVMN